MKNLVNFFYEIGTLRYLKRSYQVNLMEDTESVAEHLHRVVAIAYFLARATGADTKKVLVMAEFHDMAETRTGDSNWLQKPYLTQDEKRSHFFQLHPLGKLSTELSALLAEYKERKTLESHVVKDADNIEYVLSLRELELKGNAEAKRRLSSENTSGELLYTPKAKELIKLIKNTHPTEWTRSDMIQTFKKYKAKEKATKKGER